MYEKTLSHYGKKGMKWGVRGETSRLSRLDRVASGTGSRADKTRVALTEVSTSSVKKNQGLSGAAANKAANIRIREERISLGKASVKDILARHGGDHIFDTGRKA